MRPEMNGCPEYAMQRAQIEEELDGRVGGLDQKGAQSTQG